MGEKGDVEERTQSVVKTKVEPGSMRDGLIAFID